MVGCEKVQGEGWDVGGVNGRVEVLEGFMRSACTNTYAHTPTG